MRRREHPEPASPEALSAEGAAAGEGWLSPEPVAEALSAEDERLDLAERLARLTAEFQNSRRRLERDLEGRVERATDEALRRLLAPVDHLDFALRAAGDGGPAFVEGVALIREQLRDALAADGVREIATEGVAFDPKFHEAVAVEPRADLPPGTIVAEVRKGYLRQERVLRPAQVRVSRIPGDEGSDPPARPR